MCNLAYSSAMNRVASIDAVNASSLLCHAQHRVFHFVPLNVIIYFSAIMSMHIDREIIKFYYVVSMPCT